jgi:hypothetical protein
MTFVLEMTGGDIILSYLRILSHLILFCCSESLDTAVCGLFLGLFMLAPFPLSALAAAARLFRGMGGI